MVKLLEALRALADVTPAEDGYKIFYEGTTTPMSGQWEGGP